MIMAVYTICSTKHLEEVALADEVIVFLNIFGPSGHTIHFYNNKNLPTLELYITL